MTIELEDEMADDLCLDIDLFTEQNRGQGSQEAFVKGITTGMSCTNYLIVYGYREMPAGVYMFLKENQYKLISADYLMGEMCPADLSPFPKELFEGVEQFMNQRYQVEYIDGIIKGFKAAFFVYSACLNQRSKNPYGLLINYISRVNDYIGSLRKNLDVELVESLETILDIYISTHNSFEIRAYKDGLKTGINIFESLVERGLRHMPIQLLEFLKEKRVKRLSFGDLLIGIQKESGMSTNPALFINQDDFLCNGNMHIAYFQGMADSLNAAYAVYEETHSKTDANSDVWVEAGRLTAKFVYRVRVYIEEAR